MTAKNDPAMSSTNPVVDEWFQTLEHPLKQEMLSVRTIILEADERITESIKWKPPTYEYRAAHNHISLH